MASELIDHKGSQKSALERTCEYLQHGTDAASLIYAEAMNNVRAGGVSPATPPPVPPDGVVSGSFDIRDPNGLPMTYAITRLPALGEVDLFPDGTWTYTPTQAARLSAALAAPGTETRDTFSVEALDADGQVGGGGDSLTVAPATLALTHQIPAPSAVGAFGSALSSDGKRIFIGNFTGNDVVIVHTDDDSSQTVPLTTAGNVDVVAFGPLDRTLYITQAGITQPGPSRVIALDTSAPTTQTQLTVRQDLLAGLAVSADGKRVYVGDVNGAKVIVINTDDESTHTIPLPVSQANQPVDLALGPDHTLWVACISPAADAVGVVVIDTTTYAVTPINLESFQGASGVTIAASPDGSRMYVCQADGFYSGTGHVSVINTATYVTHAVSVPGDPISGAVSRDGSVLCVGAAPLDDSGNGILVLVDTRTEQVITTLSTTGNLSRTPLISPDGVHIYVPQSGDGARVEVYALAGTGKWSA
jgi:VCBS repeat-containing protein